MKNEHDFSKAERGRFFPEGATLAKPINLDADIQVSPTARAEWQSISLNDLVNAFLRKDIEPT